MTILTADATWETRDALLRDAPTPAAPPPAAPAPIESFVTRSSSPHAADWGRALSRALEYLTVRIAARDGVSEADALVGRSVTLQVHPLERGVEIVVRLVPPAFALLGAEMATDDEPALDLGIA